MYRRNRRILKSLVLGFAVAAFVAPAALAEPRGPGNDPVVQAPSSDDRVLYRGTSPQLDPAYLGSPDDRNVYRGVETDTPVTITLSPAIRGEHVKSLDRPSFGPISQPTVSVTADDGFQWADAGLGAVSTLALVLIMGAGALLIRQQRRRIAAY
jgi:hypothetical protein